MKSKHRLLIDLSEDTVKELKHIAVDEGLCLKHLIEQIAKDHAKENHRVNKFKELDHEY